MPSAKRMAALVERAKPGWCAGIASSVENIDTRSERGWVALVRAFESRRLHRDVDHGDSRFSIFTTRITRLNAGLDEGSMPVTR